jgi:ATP-binding cassette subfamily B protein
MTSRHRALQADTIRTALAFTFRHWRRQPGLLSVVVAGTVTATIADIFMPVFAGRLVDAVASSSGARDEALSAALHAFAAMAALGVTMLVLRQIAWNYIIPFTLRIMSDVGQDAFHRVQRFSSDWHANSFAGSTVRKITRGMWSFDTLNDTILLALLPSLVVLLGTVVVMAAYWPVMGLVMAVGSATYIALTVLLATQWIAPAARLSNAQDTRMGGTLADSLTCNAVVKSFGAESREDDRFRAVVGKWRLRTRRTWLRHNWTAAVHISVLLSLRLGITGAAIWLWWAGQATPGDVTYVLATYFVVHGYLRDVGQHVNQFQRSVNEMEELVALDREPLGVEDRTDAKPIAIGAGEVRFEHVAFHYAGHDTPLYSDMHVTIRAGERVGLVGHSGSGKTTFVKLVQRLYDVTGGRVLIDGQDVSHATQKSLRSQIAIVQQEPILFHRTLAENIAYARPDASMQEIEEAARLANADVFIAHLPRGYQTLVGERGVKLSGGERQRVALARAFLADAPILILDEATSSLDSESEALIQQAMDRLMLGRTSIIIAHRLSTVRRLDRILVFSGGRIVEQGRHDDLIALKNGRYRQLFESQAAGTVLVEEDELESETR